MDEKDVRKKLKDAKRIVIKIGSSSLTHPDTGAINFSKMEKLVRSLCDLKNQGKDVALVSSGAIAVGRRALNMKTKPDTVCVMQACASIGQARLMTAYQRLFAEYGQTIGQILMTKYTVTNPSSRENAVNTFEELFRMDIIPVVNENDTISTYEIHFGDNDSLSALVSAITGADLLILLSDIDGLYTDDPRRNEDAIFISFVSKIGEDLERMAKEDTGSNVGTGGMKAIATSSGTDMVIANGEDLENIERIIKGEKTGTLFEGKKDEKFRIEDYIEETMDGRIENTKRKFS